MHKNMQYVPMLVDKKNSVWTYNETIYKNDMIELFTRWTN
jgi:hypothetical protein